MKRYPRDRDATEGAERTCARVKQLCLPGVRYSMSKNTQRTTGLITATRISQEKRQNAFIAFSPLFPFLLYNYSIISSHSIEYAHPLA
eukprot:IDg10005t1